MRPFVHVVQIAYKAPKYAEPVVKMMSETDGVMFAKKSDFTEFLEKLKAKIEEVNSSMKIRRLNFHHHSYKNKFGRVTVFFGNDTDNYLAYFHYKSVEKVLEYDGCAEGFFDISERLD